MALERWAPRLIAAALCTAILAAAAMPAGASAAPSYVGGRATTCFWYYGPVSGDPGDLNIAYPDGNAYYWTAYFRRPAGSTLKLKGDFQHSRYESIVAYNAQSNILDGIADSQIDPDPGSVNPYRQGADRTAANRAYTVDVASAVNPGFPTNRVYEDDLVARNTLYARSNPQSNETLGGVTEELQILMVRIYAPDRSHAISAATKMPEPELTLADGTVLTGQSLCDRTDSQSVRFSAERGGALRLSDPNSLLINKTSYQALRYPDALPAGCNVLGQLTCPLVPESSWATFAPKPTQTAATPLVARPWSLRSSDPLPATFPATNPATWRSTYTRRYMMQMYTGNDAPGAETAPARFTGGVFFPNPHNNYVRAVVNRKFGKVVEATGKMPVTQRTYDDVPTLENDDVQMRYRSYCMAESIRTTRNMDCVYDEQVPIDADRRFTIAISRPDDRPANATKFCGVAWIEWTPTGDGAGFMGDDKVDEDFGWLGIRDMLPKRSYANSIQNTQTPGDEQAVIGEYLPQLTYRADAGDFEQNVGCDRANPGVPSLAAGDGTPNQGAFTLEWAATRDAETFPGMTYTLEHREGDGAWSEVAAGLSEPRHTFPSGSPEAEGSWTYRVKAVHGGSVSGYAGVSAAVLVDRTAPSLEVSCPSAVLLNAQASAVTTASDDASGLATDPSGTTAMDTSSVGPTTTTKTATDQAGNQSTRSCTTQVQYLYGGLQQPVNADGSSIFKLGSTVPLKFRLTGSGAVPVAGADARVYLAKLTGEVEGSYLEAVSTSAADTGNAFREAGTGEYRFNLSTRGLSTGTWRVKVVLDDGTSYTQQISLR